jgi:hypothetical protein
MPPTTILCPTERCLFCGGAAFHAQRFPTGAVLDFAITDVMLKGFAGRFSDGTYGFLVPFWGREISGKVLQFTLCYFMTVAVQGLTANCPGSHHEGFLAQMLPWRIQRCLLRQSCALLERCLFRGGAAFHSQRFCTAGAVLDLTIPDVELQGFTGGLSDGTYGFSCTFP